MSRPASSPGRHSADLADATGAAPASAPRGKTPPIAERAALEREWLRLTRETLPGLAAARRWPVRADHCFQRILLDAACGGRWYDHVAGRPAYAHADAAILARAVALARAAITGEADLVALNRRSLAWRRPSHQAVTSGSRSTPAGDRRPS